MIIFTTSKLSGLTDHNRPNISNMGSVMIGQSRGFHVGQNYHFKLNRLYYAEIPEKEILLLLGGNKNGQDKDIRQAKKIFNKYVSSDEEA